MKYDVTFSCGHAETVEIYGKTEDREKKIAYYGKSGICRKCYEKMMNEKNSENCEEVVTPVMIAIELSKMGYTDEELKKMKDVPETVMKDVIEMKENWTK